MDEAPKSCNLERYPSDDSPAAADIHAQAAIQSALDRATEALRSATALFVFTGAGMSVDSGIPDYRGPSKDAQWGENAELTRLYNKSTRELSENGLWFQEEPEAAWGCEVRKWLSLIAKAPPHEGYHIINKWCQRQPQGWFIATSNVDHQHIRSGASHQQVYPIHGELFGDPSCDTLVYQCSFDGTDGAGDCPGGLWKVSFHALQSGFDPSTGRVSLECLPRCHHCHRPGRPNVLAFKDDFCRVSAFALGPKREAMVNWLKALRSSAASSLVILEIGCGTMVRNPRNRTEHELEVNPNTALIRINLYESDVDLTDPRQIPIPLPAKEALMTLEERLNWCLESPQEFQSSQACAVGSSQICTVGSSQICSVGLVSAESSSSETQEDFEWEDQAEYEGILQ